MAKQILQVCERAHATAGRAAGVGTWRAGAQAAHTRTRRLERLSPATAAAATSSAHSAVQLLAR